MKTSKWIKCGKKQPTISGWYRCKSMRPDQNFYEGKYAWRYWDNDMKRWFWIGYRDYSPYIKNKVPEGDPINAAYLHDHDCWQGVIE